MELNLSIYQKIANSGLSPFVMHFPNQVARIFYIDPVSKKIMQAECDTPLGEWENRLISDSTIAYQIQTFIQSKSFYIPRELYFAYPTDSAKAEILYYDTITNQFKNINVETFPYPVVYSKFESSFAGYGLAILENATEVKIKEVINGEFTLSFVLPRTDNKWEFIAVDNFVKVEEQLFRIKSFDEQRDRQGQIKSNIQCEHVFYDAIDSKHIPYFEMIGSTPRAILEAAFSGTRFTIGTVEVNTLTDIFLDKTNPSAVINTLINNVGGEIVKDNYTIHLLNQRGSNNGVQFRIGKNLGSIKRDTNGSEIITRLFCYGKDDLDFSTVNNGVAYIDSPLLSQYDRPKIGFIDFGDIEEPAELLTKAQEQFSTDTFDGVDKPQIKYTCDILELRKLRQYGYFEKFALGDSVRIIDDAINVDTLQRVVSYEYYPFTPDKSTVELINYSVKTYSENSFGGMANGWTSTQSTVTKWETTKGEMKADWLENIVSKLQTEINSGIKKAVMHDHGDLWVDNIDNPTKAMCIINGQFAIASSKLPNGDWDWRTFGNADGFVADLINAGTLRAINIIGATIKTDDDGNDRLEMTSDGVVAKSADDVRNGVSVEKCSETGFSSYYGDFFYVNGTLAGGLLMNILGDDATTANRLWLKTNNGYKLKLLSDNNMSIDAASGCTLYIASSSGQTVHFGTNNGTTNFYGAVNVNGSQVATQSSLSTLDTAIRNWVTDNFAPKA